MGPNEESRPASRIGRHPSDSQHRLRTKPGHQAGAHPALRAAFKDTHGQHLALQRLRADLAARALQQLPQPLHSHGAGALSRLAGALLSRYDRGRTRYKHAAPLSSRKAHRSQPESRAGRGNPALTHFRGGPDRPEKRRDLNMAAVGGAETPQPKRWHASKY